MVAELDGADAFNSSESPLGIIDTSLAGLVHEANEENTEPPADEYGEACSLMHEDEGIADVQSERRLSTDTAGSDILGVIEENGRTYHKYCAGNYPLPNDKKEQARLNLQHKLWYETLGGNLFLAPVEEQLRHKAGGSVLDMGTGTGIWAIEFAKGHPASTVLGVDLSSIHLGGGHNVDFQIDDLENDWTFKDFTYIYGRMILPYLRDPAKAIAQASYALQPGGYLEIQDALFFFQCDSGSLEGTAIEGWQRMVHKASWEARRDWACPTKYKRYMENAGLVNIEGVEYRWPINDWPTNEHEKSLGQLSLANLVEWLESISMALMTRHLGMTEEQVRELLKRVEEDIMNRDIHAYIPISIIWGQKPK